MKKGLSHCSREDWGRIKKEVKVTIFSGYGTLDTAAEKFLLRGRDVLLSTEDMADELLLMMRVTYQGRHLFLKADRDSYILVIRGEKGTRTLMYQNSARFCSGYTVRDLVAYFCCLAENSCKICEESA